MCNPECSEADAQDLHRTPPTQKARLCVATYVASLPIGAFLFIGAAWFIGTLGGTLTACYIGTWAPRNFALLIGTIVLVATGINLSMIPHPLGFSIAGILAIIVAAWLGMTIGNRNRAAAR